MKLSFRTTILFLFMFQTWGQCFSADYYVSTVGNDSNSGTKNNPWRTIQHAADVIHPGDTALVRAGTYAGFQVTKSGTHDSPIRFSAYPREESLSQVTRKTL